MITAEFPEKLQCLFEPKRYKVLYGGRGGAKSWGVARALLLIGAKRPIRVLCAREHQNSLKDSVHQLLSDQISALGLQDHYIIRDAFITAVNGTTFNFEGIKYNIGKIKSYEGVDYCWVEEANKVSKGSWDVLIPTIRKSDSEIWLTFNPELDTDETYIRFVKNPPQEAIVQRITWRDNPWFPEVLRLEMEDLKARDYDAFLNVWEGQCRKMLEGVVYASELRAAQENDRITRVPYEPLVAVETFWDLGRADATSIWFAQSVGFEYRIIDFYQSNQKHLDHYLQVIQNRGYTLGNTWLPHDAKAKSIGTKKSVEEQARAKGHRVKIVPKLSVSDGINAARTIFPKCYFDEVKCADGLQALRHYRYDIDKETSTYSRNPVHDWSSHAADAWRYLAVGMKTPQEDPLVAESAGKRISEYLSRIPDSMGWMR
jgi:phage terminase large subunit